MPSDARMPLTVKALACTVLSKLPLQPYRAQGAAIAVEDAAVIGALFSRVSSLSQVPALLQAYQDLRFVPISLFLSRGGNLLSLSLANYGGCLRK